MGNNQSTFQQMSWRCILHNWKLFDPLTLRRSGLKLLFATAWSPYPLEDKEHSPEDGSLNYNTILQLDLFCKRQEKWTEIPYVQIFFQLRNMKELCLKYALKVSLLAKWCQAQTTKRRKPPIKAHLPWLSWCSFWKVVADPWKDAGVLGLWNRRIQSRARDEAWSLRPFV